MRSDKEVHIMMEEHVVLSERPEDQLKAVEWAREQKKKILDDKSRRTHRKNAIVDNEE